MRVVYDLHVVLRDVMYYAFVLLGFTYGLENCRMS